MSHNTPSPNGSPRGSEYSDFEEIDLTDNPLYQVISTVLEDSEGNNICDCINKLRDCIELQNKLLLKLLSKDSK